MCVIFLIRICLYLVLFCAVVRHCKPTCSVILTDVRIIVLMSTVADTSCTDSSSNTPSVTQQFEYIANGTCLPCPLGCSTCLAAADDVLYPCSVCSVGFIYVANPHSALTAGGRCVADCDDLGLVAWQIDSSRLRLTTRSSDTSQATQVSEGRLEVWYGSQWWSVCDDRWTMTNTDVVCREMGLGRAISFTQRYNAANLWTAISTVHMAFDDVVCNVTASSFYECIHAPFGFPPDCDEQQTVGVRCAAAPGNSARCVASCPVGQFADAAGSSCRRCDVTGCLVCPSEGVCTRCEQPLWLLNQTCVTSCPPGYYGYAGSTCRRCEAPCATCADGISGRTCTSCDVTLALDDSACVEQCPPDRLLWNVTSSVCVHSCPDGSYQPVMTSPSSLCLLCSAACKRCFGVADNCTDCATSGHVMVSRSSDVTSCESGCPVGQFPGVDNHCVECEDDRCARCYVGGQHCLACIDSSDLLEMGRCVQSCSSGLKPNPNRICLPFCPAGEYLDLSGQCQPCTPPCQDCLSAADVCVTCQPGYYLLTNQRTCVSQCGRGLVQYSNALIGDVSIRVVGGLLPSDGAVQLFTQGS